MTNSDELLTRLGGSNICSKCGKLLDQKDKRMLAIKTVVRDYNFCVPCVKDAFGSLSHKKDKTIEEVNLLMGMREFLQKVNKIHES